MLQFLQQSCNTTAKATPLAKPMTTAAIDGVLMREPPMPLRTAKVRNIW